jgi:6,7-dimethyl-8-ribityllumazine synthase
MSGAGAPRLETVDAADLRVGIVAAQWHEELTGALLAGAERYLDAAGVHDRLVLRVPGSFELPVGAKALAAAGCDAVVALGVVVRGGTPHFEYVCSAATDGLLRVTLDTGIPVGFGVLTCDTVDQAYDRAGLEGSREDKGHEAAEAAVRTALAIAGLGSDLRPEPQGAER